MAKLLLVEDDSNTVDFVSEWLAQDHYVLEVVKDGADALHRLLTCEYDLILLDWDLPNLSGFEVCRQYRQQGGMTPIIMLTGHGTITDKEAGLDVGADDYLTKPFNLKELSARIRAHLRRASSQTSNVLKMNGLELDAVNYRLSKNGAEIHLLPKEFALLEFLLRNPDKVFSGDALMQRIWQSESDASNSALRQSARMTLNCLLLASVGISLALAFYSSKQISGRINRVSDNTRRFARGQELLPALSGSDEIAELDAVFHDMAERIDEFNRKQKAAYDAIRQAERLKADVVAMVTHDLRAPLNSIMHFQEMLESGLFGPINEKGQRLLKLAGHSSRTMQTLISDLLDLEKIASGRLELAKRRVFISEIISQAIGTVQIMADENGIEIVSYPVETVVEIDPDRICQVVTNLLSNAIKFSPPHSQIKVDVVPKTASVRVSISDQGPGIAEADQDAIFERFQQAKSDKAHLGSGLGLSICKALVLLHKGNIWVESELGKGSVFSFNLPLQ
jgi:signal transduction histidine kinase